MLNPQQIQFRNKAMALAKEIAPAHGIYWRLMAAAAILAVEVLLLAYLVDWPAHLLRPAIESADLAFAEAHRAARAFRNFDERVMREQARHAGDSEKMVDIVRSSRAELSRVLAGDRSISPLTGDEVRVESKEDVKVP